MIKGAKYWNNRKKSYYDQTNNPTEGMLKKLKNLNQRNHWLESCGGEAAASCMAALGYKIEIETPGGHILQAGELIVDFLNGKKQEKELAKIRSSVSRIPGNRLPQLCPYAVKSLFGAEAEFMWTNKWWGIVAILRMGNTIQLNLKKPDHFISAVHFDESKNEIIYNDSWPRKANNFDGFNLRMTKDEYENNVKNYAIVYYPPDEE